MPPRKHWVLMISDNQGVRPSSHNVQGYSPLQKAEAVLSALPWKHLKPPQRDVLLARAASAPGEFHWHAGGGYGEGGHVFDAESGRWHEYSGEPGFSTITAHEIRELKFATIADLLTHLDAVDKFNPGPLIVPPPLVQAVLKARKEHGE